MGWSGRLASAERYAPDSQHWSGAVGLHHGRADHTATALTSGEILVVGGTSDRGSGVLRSVVFCDSRANHVISTRRMGQARAFHTATLLPSGRVLVVGGTVSFGPSAEVYDRVADQWAAAAPPLAARSWHTATLLGDGRVLVVGGRLSPGPEAEIYDAQSDTWIPTAAPQEERRAYHVASALLDRRVLVVGDTNKQGSFTSSAEIYDPDSDQWTAAESLDYKVMAARPAPARRVCTSDGWMAL